MPELVWSTPDAEKLIVKMARVSNPSNQDNMETAPKLLQYLVRHRHWSPFEMANMCVRIDTERDIAAQILRHRSFSFQEYSQRYAKVQDFSMPEFRSQDVKNRQNSIDNLSDEDKLYLEHEVNSLLGQVFGLYDTMLKNYGVAKECARRILPMCSRTTLYMSGSLRSWITYISVREKVDTQLEHRLIAKGVKKIFCAEFPLIAEGLLGYDSDWEQFTG